MRGRGDWYGNVRGVVDPDLRVAVDARDVAIAYRYMHGESAPKLAAEYGLTRARVHQILDGAMDRRRKRKVRVDVRDERRRKKRRERYLRMKLEKSASISLRDVAGVVAAQPGSPTVAGVSNQRNPPGGRN